jgi:hypothetical protein
MDIKPTLLALAVLLPSAAHAQPTSRDLVVAANTGWRFAIAPGLVVSDGEVGFSIAGDVRYGFEVGPLVLAPGARLSGFFPPGYYALSALATGRITLPLGRVGPYVVGGVGPGYVSDPSHAGAAYLGGGGLMIYLDSFAFGAELTYFGISDTDFHGFGPALLLMF